MEIKTKTTVRYHHTHKEWLNLKKKKTITLQYFMYLIFLKQKSLFMECKVTLREGRVGSTGMAPGHSLVLFSNLGNGYTSMFTL